jgi:hypothetical protein
MSPRDRQTANVVWQLQKCLAQGSRRNALCNGRKQQKVWRGYNSACCDDIVHAGVEAAGMNNNNNAYDAYNGLIELAMAAASAPAPTPNSSIRPDASDSSHPSTLLPTDQPHDDDGAALADRDEAPQIHA